VSTTAEQTTPAAAPTGDVIVEVEDLHKSFGSNEALK